MHMSLPTTDQWARHGGLTPDGRIPDASVLDLSVNINPYGPDHEFQAFLQRQAFDQYPDPNQLEVRRHIAEWQACSLEEILVGNGANELFWAAARSFLRPGDPWISVEPNYSEFARAAHRVGGRQISFRAEAENKFQWSCEDLKVLIEKHRPALVMLSNPCSPTGFLQDPLPLLNLVQTFPKVLFCLDHSFLSVSHKRQVLEGLQWPDHVLRFQSLTKDFSIAGLRLGFVRGLPARLVEMKRDIPTWSVNSIAQAAGIWIARHANALDPLRQQWLNDHKAMEQCLRDRSIAFIPSETVFTMIRPPEAAALAERLWKKHRILLRHCESYGLPDWLRLAARPQALMHHFWQALDEEIS